MTIKGIDIGKKFGKNWVFRNLNFEVKADCMTAIVGKNGAGKSTLLQIISGYLTPSEGSVQIDNTSLEEAEIGITLIGPYTETVEEFTLREFLDFHQKFKQATISVDEMAQRASLPLDKQILDFSTGMKQRTKLITAFYFENDLILMDEPTSNLDEEGFQWWKNSLEFIENKLVVIASNDQKEIETCSNRLSL